MCPADRGKGNVENLECGLLTSARGKRRIRGRGDFAHVRLPSALYR
jgi:hypothetical protein